MHKELSYSMVGSTEYTGCHRILQEIMMREHFLYETRWDFYHIRDSYELHYSKKEFVVYLKDLMIKVINKIEPIEGVKVSASDIRILDLGYDLTQITYENVFCIYIDTDHHAAGEDRNNDSSAYEPLMVYVDLLGESQIVSSFKEALKSHLDSMRGIKKSALVKWIYSGRHGGSTYTGYRLTKDWEIDPSFYPWIQEPLADYYNKFINSKSQILILFGPPGTGKTFWLRDFLCETGTSAAISYDMKILESDEFFSNYLSDKVYNTIILEDADELLTSERGSYNKIITKILNVSDGLIKVPKKKLIFTTNLPKVSDIDPAISRPGRCYGFLNFRALNHSNNVNEARVVAKSLGIDLDKYCSDFPTKSKSKFTLAELFAIKNEEVDTSAVHKSQHTSIGFT